MGIQPCGDTKAWTQGVSITSVAPCECCDCMCFPAQEVPAGTIDGVNKVFTLAYAPISDASLMVFTGGLLQVQGSNYTVNGQNITFSTASVPTTGSSLVAYYIRRMPDGRSDHD